MSDVLDIIDEAMALLERCRIEREAGVTASPARRTDGREGECENPRLRTSERANSHPTVKSIELMRWLCRLVTPPGGLILDPFTGSGSTGCAAVLEGFSFAGCERDPEYVQIARQRIAHWERQQDTQLDLFAKVPHE